MPEEAAVESTSPSSTQVSESTNGFGESTNREMVRSAESVSNGTGADKPKADKPKELSRYEKARRHREALRQREVHLERRIREFDERERAAAEAARKAQEPYTLDDYKYWRDRFDQEGRDDLVEAADKKIKEMEARAKADHEARHQKVDMPKMGTPEHRAQWEAAERELAQADSEFMREGTPLDSRLREIMAGPDGNIYREHPRGIIAAYHRAKMELLEASTRDLRTALDKKDQELKRYEGLTSISGGSPAKPGGPRVQSLKDFERLSTKEMRAHLLATAKKEGNPFF